MPRFFNLEEPEPEPEPPKAGIDFGARNFDPRSLTKVDDCDTARIVLMGQINDIELQLVEYEDEKEQYPDPAWARSAAAALRNKRFRLQLVNERRGLLAREERYKRGQAHAATLITLLKEIDPDAFVRLMTEARRRKLIED